MTKGHGSLEVRMVSGQSAVTAAYATSPFKLLIPRPRGPSIWGYMSCFGGGLLAGDQIEFQVQLGENTRCFLSTQAATKVYRSPEGQASGHQLNARLEPGSLLALAPDPIQAFAGSLYCQRQQFHLQSGCGLVLVDWICGGRCARGERWAFTRFQSRNEIYIGQQRLLIDSLLLEPADGPLNEPHRLGRFNCLALVVIIGQPLQEAASRLLAEINALAISRQAPLVCGASPIADGVLMRLAGEGAEPVGAQIHRHLSFLPRFLADDPWSRKW